MKLDNLYSMEPIGNYTDMETALAHVSQLEELWSKLGNNKYEEAVFDIIDFELDEQPYLLDYLKNVDTTLQDDVSGQLIKLMGKGHKFDKLMGEDEFGKTLTDGLSDQLIKLMNEGLVDQLVGEDGNFYYRLTDSGKKIAIKNRKKFFGK
ncbi:MAG: hypothetical protein ABGY11_15020 [Candidatus Thioglobus sp.]